MIANHKKAPKKVREREIKETKNEVLIIMLKSTWYFLHASYARYMLEENRKDHLEKSVLWPIAKKGYCQTAIHQIFIPIVPEAEQ